MSVDRFSIQLIIFQHSEQKTVSQCLIVEIVTPLCQHIRRAYIDMAVDQVFSHFYLPIFLNQIWIQGDIMAAAISLTNFFIMQASVCLWSDDKHRPTRFALQAMVDT